MYVRVHHASYCEITDGKIFFPLKIFHKIIFLAGILLQTACFGLFSTAAVVSIAPHLQRQREIEICPWKDQCMRTGVVLVGSRTGRSAKVVCAIAIPKRCPLVCIQG